MAGHGDLGTPDWGTLSRDLLRVIRTKGPQLIGSISGEFRRTHARSLTLHGHKLKDCLADGKLQGMRFNPQRYGGAHGRIHEILPLVSVDRRWNEL